MKWYDVLNFLQNNPAWVVCGEGIDGQDCYESVILKLDQSWVFIGGTDAEAETPILWPPDEKSWLIWKDPEAGKDWRQEKKGTTEDEMVGWHHRLNGMSLSKLRELVMDRRPGVLQSMGWQGVRHNWATELNWTNMFISLLFTIAICIIYLLRGLISFLGKYLHY